MDHYIPKRRIPVTLWSDDKSGVPGRLFLDLDSNGHRHPTILDKLNESTPFLPVAIGEQGRIHLFNRRHLTRVTPGHQVIQSDVYARGFEPWREERAEVSLVDGTHLSGMVWMPLDRETQRLSDFLNHRGGGFFVLTTTGGIHLVNAAALVEVELAECAGAPIEANAVDVFGMPAGRPDHVFSLQRPH